MELTEKHIEKFRKLLRDKLKETGLSQKEFAEKLGITAPYLNQILKGKRQAVKSLIPLAQKAGIDLSLVFDKPTKHLYGPVPVISWVQAGEFKETLDLSACSSEEDVYSTKKVSSRAFALKIKDDSMTPRFLPGDIIIVDPEVIPQSGDFCVAWLNGEVTFKKFYENDKEIRLIPLNEKYPVIVIEKGKSVDFRLIGKVVDFIAKM